MHQSSLKSGFYQVQPGFNRHVVSWFQNDRVAIRRDSVMVHSSSHSPIDSDRVSSNSQGATPSAGQFAQLEVALVPFDPGLPPRLTPADPDAQCDCACFAMEGEAVPPLRAPVSFYLELTPLCNSNCAGCGNVFTERGSQQKTGITPPPLSAGSWAQILKELKPYAYRLKLTGGEPTIHPEFETIVESVSSLQIPFTLFTNGRWQAPERLCSLLNCISCFDGFLVSLHGPTPTAHEAFTGQPGSFAETLTSIRMAIKAKLPVSLSCVITRHNWHLAEEMLKTATQLGADSVVFNRYLGPPTTGLAAGPEELRAAVRSIRALRAAGEHVKFGNCLPACFAPTDQAGCLAGIAFFTVDPWGQARPCNHASLVCGSLVQQSVETIWHSPVMGRWRALYAAQCESCAAFADCRGGCRAQALAYDQEADPLMGPALHSPPERPRVRWAFYDQARPVARFARRTEAFGLLLISGNQLFPVSYDRQPIVDTLDGQTTLQQIQAAHGTSGLALVASLYQRGMIDLRA
jgi:radical SAM protein with 4Fe4S-binding SPASM domain